jgi:hypothetical protein
MCNNPFTGIGVTNIMKIKDTASDAIWNPFATNGIILGLINLSPLIYLLMKFVLSKEYGIVIILLLNQMQRGLVGHILHLFLIGIIILHLEKKHGKIINSYRNI